MNSRLAHAAAPFGCHSQEGTRHQSLHHLKLYVLVSTQGTNLVRRVFRDRNGMSLLGVDEKTVQVHHCLEELALQEEIFQVIRLCDQYQVKYRIGATRAREHALYIENQ